MDGLQQSGCNISMLYLISFVDVSAKVLGMLYRVKGTKLMFHEYHTNLKKKCS